MKLLVLTAVFFGISEFGATEDPKVTLPGNKTNPHDDIWEINKNLIQNRGISKFGATEDPKEDDLLEGDIVMTNKLKDFLNKQKSGISTYDAINNGAWPGARIPYSYNRLPYGSRNAVDQAIREYHAKTCIRFVKRTNQRNYLDFFVGGGCYSMIGRQGGRQQVSLGRGCGTKGVAIHEMMHALGFFHEQSRRDRDSYIRVMWANIPGRVRYNFEKYGHGKASTLGEPYDKRSVMHYGNYAFSNNRRKTIISRSNPNEVLGQRRGLSTIDVRQLKKYYKCGGVTTTVTKKKPITRPVDCKDGYSLCPTLAKAGLCSVSVSWVRINCKKSCKKCPTKPRPSKPICKNKSQQGNCRSWKASGYCTRTYKIWMQSSCANCGVCRNA